MSKQVTPILPGRYRHAQRMFTGAQIESWRGVGVEVEPTSGYRGKHRNCTCQRHRYVFRVVGCPRHGDSSDEDTS